MLADNHRRRANELGRPLKAIAHPAATLRHARSGWPAMCEFLAEEPGPPTSLNRLVGPHLTLALIRNSLSLVTDIAHARGATINDVLLAVTAGGLRELLLSRGEPVDELTLPIYVPVSLRRDRTRPGADNLISQMVVPLPLGTSDPGHRVRQIAAATAIRKSTGRPSLGTVFRSKAVARAMLPLIARRRVNIETADLPGPSAPLYFCGAQLLEVFPLLNLIGNVSLGVGALSYAGQFNIMAIGDADAYPDIEVFTVSARNELQALADARKPVTQTR